MAAMQAAKENPGRTPFVMGDDPERMDADAVVAAEPLRAGGGATAGYLYLVAHRDGAGGSRWEALRSSFALPSLALIGLIVALTTLLAALVIASVTRPLRRLTDAVASLSRSGLEESSASATHSLLPPPTRDEFGQLTAAFEMMLATLRRQWGALRRLDHFRREGVSNLSHDLRSPLTATAACLETLEQRWGVDATRTEDRRLLEVALRNTRNAARLVQSLGDLAKLDEPEFRLRVVAVDVGELLDDIRVRFAARAAQGGVALGCVHAEEGAAAYAAVDVELFERAIANLIDNALKFCPGGSRITLGADPVGPQRRGAGRGRRPRHRRHRPALPLRSLLPEPPERRPRDRRRRPGTGPGHRQADRRAARRRGRREQRPRVGNAGHADACRPSPPEPAAPVGRESPHAVRTPPSLQCAPLAARTELVRGRQGEGRREGALPVGVPRRAFAHR